MATSIAKAFSKAAQTYQAHAQMQMEAAHWLLEAANPGNTVLDLGCGTGWVGSELLSRRQTNNLIYLDISHAMLAQIPPLKGKRVCADMQHLPFAKPVFDLITANLSLHWSLSPQNTLKQLSQVMRAEGQLLFTVPTIGSLTELNHCWSQIDPEISHIHQFKSVETWHRWTQHAFPKQRISYSERPFIYWFTSPYHAINSIRKVGANHIITNHRHTLTGKRRWLKMLALYEQFRTDQGIPLSYQLLRLQVDLKP